MTDIWQETAIQYKDLYERELERRLEAERAFNALKALVIAYLQHQYHPFLEALARYVGYDVRGNKLPEEMTL